MLNKKKGLAMLLAATMVVGSSFSVLAAETNSGSTTGAGTSEGHVEKKATKVVLPTETTDYDTSTFAYKMDPEGLIAETDGGKYEAGTSFPDPADDTGVYFLTDTKKYENNSKALTVENQSSHNIDLTVKAEVASPAAKDIPLVAESALAGAENASLYLGLVVGSETPKEITTASAAEIKVTLAGKSGRFGVKAKADQTGYEYGELTLDEYKNADAANVDATELPAWEKTTFKLEGATTTDKAITAEMTAPSVKVTWSWTDPTAAPPAAAPSVTDTTVALVAGNETVVNVDLGAGDKAAQGIASITFQSGNGTVNTVNTTKYSYADGKITFTDDWAAIQINGMGSGGTRTFTVTFDDTENTQGTFTATAP